MGKVLNIAHRGASGHAPENTMAAFEKALELGAEHFEFDLHLTRDRRLVVIHDPGLSRTTGGSGRVGQSSLAQLQLLDAGAWFDRRYAGQRVPTLEEVLERFGQKVRFNIEIKTGWRPYRGLEERLLDCVRQTPLKYPPILSCFQHSVLQKIRRLDTEIPIGYLFKRGSVEDILHRAKALRAESLHGSVRVLSPALIQRGQKQGFKVFVYTVDERMELEKWIGLGVDGIFTNYPDRLAALLSMT